MAQYVSNRVPNISPKYVRWNAGMYRIPERVLGYMPDRMSDRVQNILPD